nr:hypothetical protein [Tanacetum cinerariifolium]
SVGRKSNHRKKTNIVTSIGSVTESDGNLNDATPLVASIKKKVVSPYVDETMAKDKQTPTIIPKSFPPLTTPVTTMAGDAHGKSSYANIAGKPSGKKVNVCTLFTPGGNRINLVVLVDSLRAISERFANTAYSFFLVKKVAYPVVANYEDVSTILIWVKIHGVPVMAFSKDGLSVIATKLGTPLMLDSYTSVMCMQSWGRSSYARVMIELRSDVELKDNIVVAMPKITREAHYKCNVHVEFERKPPRCSSCKVFRHIHEECPKNTGAGEKKTVKMPNQTSRGVLIGPKMGFKPKKVYRPVTKKPNATSSSNKKKGVEPTIEVSNSNPFDVLNSVDNDVEVGTNRETTNLVNNGAILIKSSFMNIDNDGKVASNTPIGEKIKKIKRQICKGKLRISTSDKDRSDKGYGTNSLLEQWRDSYPNNDDYDPYDDDMYENHDLSEYLQSICDDLDITVRGRKKK